MDLMLVFFLFLEVLVALASSCGTRWFTII